jgi:cAMP-dependent protein kinase regulator
MSSNLPPAIASELDTLTSHLHSHQPSDVVQFCADYFNRRLQEQRADYRSQLHIDDSSPSKAAAANSGPRAQMAESTFPGSNSTPFGTSQSTAGMHRLDEEEENDHLTSPTDQRSRPQGNMDTKPPSSTSSAFGNFGGFGSTVAAGGALDMNSLPSNYNLNRRTSVSAESLNPAHSANDNWSPPFHQKTPEQQARLKKAVANNFLFSHLDDEQSVQVLGALQEKVIPAKGIKVISQGDQGDYFYVVESGNFDIFVNKSGKIETGPDGLGDKVGNTGPGGSFGELALMYNAPRAATVQSTEPSTLWALDRLTFRRILMDSAFQRRRMYENFLDSVPLLAPLSSYDRSKIADALETQKYPAGSTIIREGDPGSSFYILESGEAEVYKKNASEPSKPVNKYKKGDYFGELALLNDAPRAASVVAVTDVKVASLDKDAFQRLLGPVEKALRGRDYSQEEGVDPLHKK